MRNMEKFIVRTMAIAFVILGAVGVAALLFIPEGLLTSAEAEETSVRSFVIETGGSHDLAIRIPPGVVADEITTETKDADKIFRITVPGFNENDFYDYPMEGECEGIKNITYAQEGRNGIFEIETERLVYLDTNLGADGYLYIDIVDLHDRYDFVIVVDAGHGGIDTGAEIGNAVEKDLTLSVVEKLKKHFDGGENIKVFYTRLSDVDMDVTERAALAQEAGADFFLSVHMNSTASGRMSAIKGASVLYKVSDESGESMAFAGTLLDALIDETGCDSKGLIAGDEIYIIRTAQMPVALVECGFLTNEEEQELLLEDSYQEKLAKGLYNGIKTTLEGRTR